MKKAILILTISFLSACTMNTKTSDSNASSVTSDITYTKDTKTGLCFGLLSTMNNGYNSVSVTCVPCDSLKKVKVVEVN